jgi:AbrB family looped-hinge helix DNA binding protein
MRNKTRIDPAGRIVIPKELRQRYGFDTGRAVQIIPLPDGISIIPEQNPRRFIRRGPILTIDTGTGTVPIEDFDPDWVRDESLNGKIP